MRRYELVEGAAGFDSVFVSVFDSVPLPLFESLVDEALSALPLDVVAFSDLPARA
jgi:hypothetical protein